MPTAPLGNSSHRVYLDNAATSWPKCPAALAAAEEFVHHCGATSGRGAYQSAQQADRWLESARTNLARLVGAPSGGDIAICSSGTHALNAGLWGVLQAGDHVVTTSMEHNSLLRPLKQLEQSFDIQFTVVEGPGSGCPSVSDAQAAIRPNTKLLAIGHASNVTGLATDLNAWGQLAKRAGAQLMVDASQTLGYLPIHVEHSGIDILACAGHKGLRALAGTGFLYVQRDLQTGFRPLMLGGTGRLSESIDAVPQWPLSIEVGNLNMPGVISMAIAAEHLAAEVDPVAAWIEPFGHLLSGLGRIPGVKIVARELRHELEKHVPVVSLAIEGWDVHDFAAILDTNFQIEVRAGWHCAALVHRDLGTTASHGTLRLSTGRATSMADIEYTLQAFAEVLS